MIKIDTDDIKRLEKDLRTFARKAMPYATRWTLNAAVKAGRKHWQEEIGDKLINRNAFTKSAVRFEETKSLEIRSQRAVLGSVAPYMDTTEHGGSLNSKAGASSIPLATSFSAGQGNAKPRTKLARDRNRLSKLRITSRYRSPSGNWKQEAIVRVRSAIEDGSRVVYLSDRGGGWRRGIYAVQGGSKAGLRKRGAGRGWPIGAKLKRLHDLSRDNLTAKATPTLAPALKRVQKDMPDIYRKALEFQLKRARVFGY